VNIKNTVAVAGLLLACLPSSFAQRLNPAHWSATVEPAAAAPGGKVLIKAAVKLDEGWHLYSLSTPSGGPIPTTLSLAPNPAITGFKLYEPKPVRRFDQNFNLYTETYEGEPVFLLEAELAKEAPAGNTELSVNAQYAVCRATECLPPRKVALPVTLSVDAKASSTAPVIPTGYVLYDPAKEPVQRPTQSSSSQAPQGLGPFLLLAFGAGLAAIFTPCVFPMIPITLSFFLNRQGITRGESLKQAAIFCLGIILLFTGLGLSIAALAGPFGVLQLASNPWVNAFIALVFLVFGLSLLGAFEITLPSGLVNRMNRASERGGIGGTLLMGLTFSLTSFACVGPFVGTLLAASVQQGGIQPALGMITFATGLASPFFLLALFPSYLQRLPRSGGWLVRVKVVLGFIVLAAMLKYVSSIDQVLQWNVLTRERFLAAWVVLFALPGLYLLGFLRLEGIDKDEPLGVKRMLIGALFLIFSFSLVPGMFGHALGELDSYVPLAQGGPASQTGETSVVWMKNQYAEALKKAREENKLVLVNFTGYACTNCHWMKANMFPRPEIAAALKNLVLVELYTDGTDPASEQNQKLQDSKFATVAIPFYAIIDPDEKVIASWGGIQRSAPEFLAFLTAK
jgi:thiol:disulfide interchange protein